MRQTRAVMEAVEKARKAGMIEEGPKSRLDGCSLGLASGYQTALDLAMLEAPFQRVVIQYAQDHSWLVFHARRVKAPGGHLTAVAGDGKGFPDLTLVRGMIAYAELKSQKGKLSEDQKKWRDAIRATQAPWRLWRPADWPEIMEFLR